MKNLKGSHLFILLFGLALAFPSNAQTDSIDLKLGYFVKNGEINRFGFLYKNLKSELKVSPNAMIEYEKFEKNGRRFLILYGAATVLTVTGLFIGSKDGDFGFPDKQSSQEKKAFYYTGGGLALLSIPFGFKANKKLKEAVRVYNSDLLR